MTIVQRLELNVTDNDAVLLRIVSVCHRRRYPIVSLRYERYTDGARVILDVEADSRRTGRLELWLSNLIHVITVGPPQTLREATV